MSSTDMVWISPAWIVSSVGMGVSRTYLVPMMPRLQRETVAPVRCPYYATKWM